MSKELHSDTIKIDQMPPIMDIGAYDGDIVIGEATSKILQSHMIFVSKHPEVPWGQMRWMRNRIAHGYFDINFHVVWSAIQVDLPPLRLSLASIQRQIASRR